MAKEDKKQTERSGASERAFRLTSYYKIVTVLTLIVAVAYGALYVARQKGYQLINTSILYWLWYALIICIILLIGKFLSNLPKNESTRRSVRISVGIITVCTIFAMYVFTISQIDNNFSKYATLDSPDGAHQVIVMRADVKVAKTETNPAKVYTLYGAYEKLNSFFCKNNPGEADIIMLQDDPDAKLDYDWSGNTVTLSTSGNTTEGSDTISLTLE